MRGEGYQWTEKKQKCFKQTAIAPLFSLLKTQALTFLRKSLLKHSLPGLSITGSADFALSWDLLVRSKESKESGSFSFNNLITLVWVQVKAELQPSYCTSFTEGKGRVEKQGPLGGRGERKKFWDFLCLQLGSRKRPGVTMAQVKMTSKWLGRPRRQTVTCFTVPN